MSVAVRSGIGAPNLVGFEWHVVQFLPTIACTSQGRSEEIGAFDVPPLAVPPVRGGCEEWPPVVAGGVDELPPLPETAARPPVAVILGIKGIADAPPVLVASPQLQTPTAEPVGLHAATPGFPSAQVQAT
jgi:hypothetical protein